MGCDTLADSRSGSSKPPAISTRSADAPTPNDVAPARPVSSSSPPDRPPISGSAGSAATSGAPPISNELAAAYGSSSAEPIGRASPSADGASSGAAAASGASAGASSVGASADVRKSLAVRASGRPRRASRTETRTSGSGWSTELATSRRTCWLRPRKLSSVTESSPVIEPREYAKLGSN